MVSLLVSLSASLSLQPASAGSTTPPTWSCRVAQHRCFTRHTGFVAGELSRVLYARPVRVPRRVHARMYGARTHARTPTSASSRVVLVKRRRCAGGVAVKGARFIYEAGTRYVRGVTHFTSMARRTLNRSWSKTASLRCFQLAFPYTFRIESETSITGNRFNYNNEFFLSLKFILPEVFRIFHVLKTEIEKREM